MPTRADELRNRLNQSNILNEKGHIHFTFQNIRVQLQDKSAIGYQFQEWLGEWMQQQGISFRINPNTQEFPDFYLHPTSDITDLLEIKTFNRAKSANFDVANFESYCSSLLQQSYRLDADYLIFGYRFENGVFSIQDIWLKKIWEITCPSDRYSIKTQTKRNIQSKPTLSFIIQTHGGL